MRSKVLCLLALAAAATAGAASAQNEAPKPVVPLTAGPLPVFAVVGHHVVSGELRPGETLMALSDAREPTFSCDLSENGPQITLAEITLSCSDGSTARVRLNKATSCGRSWSGQRASMCIGYPPKYAVRQLTAPAGKTLRIEGEGLVLAPGT